MPTEDDYFIDVEDDKYYLLSGKLLNRMYALIKRNRPKAGAGIRIAEHTDGTFIFRTSGTAGSGIYNAIVTTGGQIYEGQIVTVGPLVGPLT